MRKSSHHKLGPIVAADFSPARQQWALSQGADIVVDAAIENPLHHDELKDHNVVVFECVGIPGMIDKLFLDVPNNTHIVVVGVCLQSDQIRPLIAINKELSLQFVLGYSVNEFAQSLNYIADGSFDVAGLVSHSIGLDEVEQTFASLAQPDAFGKVIVKPWAD